MRIVCSIDESSEARNAAQFAAQLADRMRAELVFAHAETGETSQPVGVRSESRRCDLLVVGFKARARFSSALLGDRCRRLVRGAVCPVMLVPAAAQLRAGANVVLGYEAARRIGQDAAVVTGRLLDGGVIVVGARPAGWRGLLHRPVAAQLRKSHPVLVVPRRASPVVS